MEKAGRKTAVVSDYELMRQREFCTKVNSVISKRYSAPPLACVVTYGCQQNVADSEHIKGMLAEMGYGFTEERTKAQLIIFNTCASMLRTGFSAMWACSNPTSLKIRAL